MRATMLLADWAEALNGKLYVMGAAWTHVLAAGTPTSMSLGVVMHVPWDEANRRKQFVLALQDHDGNAIQQNDVDVRAEGQFEAGRPPGLKAGTELNNAVTFRFNNLTLDEGGYVWLLTVDDEQLARTPFFVLPPPPQSQPPQQ
jgi:hypothetical protein